MLHVSPDAQLFSPDDLADAGQKERGPEEERGGQVRGVVCREQEMDKEEGEGEVEDVRWFAHKVEQIEYASQVTRPSA